MKRISRWFTAVALVGAFGFEGGAVLAQTESVLYYFKSGPGPGPESLTMDSQGNLYGVLEQGGDVQGYAGEVYELSPPYGQSNLTVLYSFTDGADGGFPDTNLIMDSQGNLYGATAQGGDLSKNSKGSGVIFKLSLPYGQNSETVLYTFNGGADGAFPNGLIMDGQGNLYGTTSSAGNLGEPPYTGFARSAQGGVFGITAGHSSGVVFKLSPPYGQNSETVLYTFNGGADGGTPVLGSLIMDAQGNLYGTTAARRGGFGVVYRLSPPYGQNSETVLYTFNGGTDGSFPNGALVQDAQGNLYGTTVSGGAYDSGQIYQLSPPYGQSAKTVLYSFTGGSDGGYPEAGVIIDAQGNLYGTTFFGGKNNSSGAAYELLSPYGQSNEIVLHNFVFTDGRNPLAGLIMDSQGNLYGTAAGGGQGDRGVVFEITP